MVMMYFCVLSLKCFKEVIDYQNSRTKARLTFTKERITEGGFIYIKKVNYVLQRRWNYYIM